MSAPTKKRPIRKKRGLNRISKPKRNSSWRNVAKREIQKYSEGGVMLRACRYKGELTQKALAEELEISQHHISEMENGKRPIGKAIAKRLASFFKTDYRVFL
ncbi:MAG: helix-turn-helix transcriptional regulator [Chlamydiia bacterium]|nr:helix-turn-helix transcriptional regulator [Chlamydiia bacterium]